MASRAFVRLLIVEQSYGLPEATVPRPPATQPAPFMGFITDATVVLRSAEL
jgi:hypothetical protein